MDHWLQETLKLHICPSIIYNLCNIDTIILLLVAYLYAQQYNAIWGHSEIRVKAVWRV